MHPKISLEQWRALTAVVESGGYAQAAEALHKSQSTVSYAVQKIEDLLKLKIFELQGRKAVLTQAGQVLYRRARTLLEEAGELEEGAAGLAAGWEAELKLAVEIVFPTWLLLDCLGSFGAEHPQTRIELYESVLGGTDELLLERRVDIAIASMVPPGFLADPLMQLNFVAAAAPAHPLHRLGRKLSHRDLRKHRHLVVRDSGLQRKRRGVWEGAQQRWTVSHKATQIRAAVMGYGFAWFPEDNIREELRSGQLKPLPLAEGATRQATLYLIFADRDYPSRAATRLGEIIRERVKAECSRAAATRR